MAIGNADQLIAALTGGQSSPATAAVPVRIPIVKTMSTFTTVAGQYTSSWTALGLPTAAAATPGASWLTPTQATSGGMAFAAAAGSNSRYLGGLALGLTSVGTLLVYDRLGHMSGLSGTSVASQTVSSGTLPTGRCDANGIGVEWFVECYVLLGVTSRTLTVTYTDDTGATGLTTSVTIPANMRPGAMVAIPPGTGKKAIKSIQSVILSASTGTAGDFGISAARKIHAIPCPLISSGDVLGPIDLLQPIHADTCLWIAVIVNTVTMGNIFGSITLIEG